MRIHLLTATTQVPSLQGTTSDLLRGRVSLVVCELGAITSGESHFKGLIQQRIEVLFKSISVVVQTLGQSDKVDTWFGKQAERTKYAGLRCKDVWRGTSTAVLRRLAVRAGCARCSRLTVPILRLHLQETSLLQSACRWVWNQVSILCTRTAAHVYTFAGLVDLDSSVVGGCQGVTWNRKRKENGNNSCFLLYSQVPPLFRAYSNKSCDIKPNPWQIWQWIQNAW